MYWSILENLWILYFDPNIEQTHATLEITEEKSNVKSKAVILKRDTPLACWTDPFVGYCLFIWQWDSWIHIFLGLLPSFTVFIWF